MHGSLVRALTPEEPAWEGTPGETHIQPAYGLPIRGAMGCFSLGVVKSGGALWQVPSCGIHIAGDRQSKLSRTRP